MSNDKTKGIIYLLAAFICLIAYVIPVTNASLVVAGLFTCIVLYLTVVMCIKQGTGMGPFAPVVNIVFALFTVGIVASIVLKDVTGTYILGFTPGAACVIYFVWIVPFALDVAYTKFYPYLLTDEELAEFKEEGGNVNV